MFLLLESGLGQTRVNIIKPLRFSLPKLHLRQVQSGKSVCILNFPYYAARKYTVTDSFISYIGNAFDSGVTVV